MNTNDNSAEELERLGLEMHSWAKELFPICRSLTGDGVRQTLRFLKAIIPAMEIHEIPSGTKAFDWKIPQEWSIREAWIEFEDGTRIADFADSNLHVLGYSVAVDREISLDELQAHLYSLPEQPDWIPYVCSFYSPRWGFCLRHSTRMQLKEGRYRVKIDSTHHDGSMSFGELVLPGRTSEEIFVSTYICHPSMANNELSGPVVATALARFIQALPDRRYTYRFVWAPETIGAIAYISRNLGVLTERVVAAFNLTCVGDDRIYSFLPSRLGNTLADRVGRHVLGGIAEGFKEYDFLDRGSDERQYCSPGVDLPMVSLMRSKYGCYPEYHTSADDLQNVVTPTGLAGGFKIHQECIQILESNEPLWATHLCEAQLGKHGLYPTISTGQIGERVFLLSNILAYADGRDLLSIAERIGAPALACLEVVRDLLGAGVLSHSPPRHSNG